MNNFSFTGKTGTTTSTEASKKLLYSTNTNRNREKQTLKKIELPAFKTMPITDAFCEIQDSINNQKKLFGDLLTQGDFVILFGRSNIGKSFLSHQIGEAIATGKNVLNLMDEIELINQGETDYYNLNNECEPQKVLYVDFESTIEKDYIRYSNQDLRRTDNTVKPYQFSKNFIVAFPERLTVSNNLEFIDAIEQEVIKTQVRVLIIDNISAISTDNEKSGQAVKLMSRIKDMQRRNKLTILLMAHTPKIVEGEPIIGNNLAGSANLYNLADSVLAINKTTMSDDIRYIKQLKSRYNEIVFHQDNVVTIQFCTKSDGLKGFRFIDYENEEELIKYYDKTTKSDENDEIINLTNYFGMKPAQIAEELHNKYAPDVSLKVYKIRVIKRIQRLKAKGLLKPEKELSEPTRINNNKTNIINETPEEKTKRICRELGIKTHKEREQEELEENFKRLFNTKT